MFLEKKRKREEFATDAKKHYPSLIFHEAFVRAMMICVFPVYFDFVTNSKTLSAVFMLKSVLHSAYDKNTYFVSSPLLLNYPSSYRPINLNYTTNLIIISPFQHKENFFVLGEEIVSFYCADHKKI